LIIKTIIAYFQFKKNNIKKITIPVITVKPNRDRNIASSGVMTPIFLACSSRITIVEIEAQIKYKTVRTIITGEFIGVLNNAIIIVPFQYLIALQDITQRKLENKWAYSF